MVSAAWVKLRPASRTSALTFHVLPNGKLRPTLTAEDSLFIPLHPGPDLRGMNSQRVVALPAGIKSIAALHFDRDDVSSGIPMRATSLRVYL